MIYDHANVKVLGKLINLQQDLVFPQYSLQPH